MGMNPPTARTIKVNPRAMQEAFDNDGIRASLRLLRQRGPDGDPSILTGSLIMVSLFFIATLAIVAVGA